MKIGLFSAGDLELRGLDALVTSLARSSSDCTSFMFELEAFDVVGDMAYTAGLEHTSASVALLRDPLPGARSRPLLARQVGLCADEHEGGRHAGLPRFSNW